MSIKSIVSTYCPSSLRPAFDRVIGSPIGARLARGMFWSMVGSVISRGLTMCAMILVARILGKTAYGELGMIQSTVGTFGVFAGFGLGLTATKHVAEYRQSDPERAGRVISLSRLVAVVTGGSMAVGLLVFAPWLAEHTISAPHLVNVLRIGTLILFVSALNGAQTGALSGFEAFRTIAAVNSVAGLLSFPVLVCGAWFGGLSGAVWALVINLGFNWMLNHLALRKEAQRHSVPLRFWDCRYEWPVLWKFSLPAALAGSITGPTNWICNAMLVKQPQGYAEMGILSAANQWYTMLLFVPSILGNVVLPVLSEQLGQNNTTFSSKMLTVTIKMSLVVVAPLVCIASIASPYIMNLYGEGFNDGWPTLVVVLLTAGLVAAEAPVGQTIAASGRMWIGFVMNVGWALTFVVSTLVLAGHGSLGLAFSRMISYIVHAIWTFGFAIWVTRKKVRN